MKRALDNATQTELRQRIVRRLEECRHLLPPDELVFLMAMHDLQAMGGALSEWQTEWLEEILERTEKAVKVAS